MFVFHKNLPSFGKMAAVSGKIKNSQDPVPNKGAVHGGIISSHHIMKEVPAW